mmetsp:Transcript_103940/g.333197  ORF Transcript_103940/g.333197 Transcript_103940/m.333197 type:complete len:238 (+) Transcript_103940:5354-6067(+)
METARPDMSTVWSSVSAMREPWPFCTTVAEYSRTRPLPQPTTSSGSPPMFATSAVALQPFGSSATLPAALPPPPAPPPPPPVVMPGISLGGASRGAKPKRAPSATTAQPNSLSTASGAPMALSSTSGKEPRTASTPRCTASSATSSPVEKSTISHSLSACGLSEATHAIGRNPVEAPVEAEALPPWGGPAGELRRRACSPVRYGERSLRRRSSSVQGRLPSKTVTCSTEEPDSTPKA